MTVEALGSMFYTRMHISTVYVHKEFWLARKFCIMRACPTTYLSYKCGLLSFKAKKLRGRHSLVDNKMTRFVSYHTDRCQLHQYKALKQV